MKKEQVFSLLRQVLSFAGAVFIGKAVAGQPLDEQLIETIIGTVLAVAGLFWGIMDKTAGIEMWQSALRHVVSTIGGILVGRGYMKPETLLTLLGIIAPLIALLQGMFSRKKVQDLKDGELGIHTLKGEHKV